MMHVETILKVAASRLAQVTTEAKLDAELLLSCVLKKPRSYLHAWPYAHVSGNEISLFETYLTRRLHGEPLAYIIGEKEFWSLSLSVTNAVLIPRPETELLVETTLQLLADKNEACIADLGTGSGAIAIALASERNHWQIHATDISSQAINLAKQNAEKFSLSNITFSQGDWCEALPQKKFTAIISNPPYISQAEWLQVSENLKFEPALALTNEDGLCAYRNILRKIKDYVEPNAYVLFEHGNTQALALQRLLENAGFIVLKTLTDYANHPRVTIAVNRQL